MVRFTESLLLLLTALSSASPVDQQQPPLTPPSPLTGQHVLDVSHARIQAGNPRKLRGKFLHITDVHPDPFYRQGSEPDGEHPCHKGEGSAGFFGAEKTDCDSPFALVNATFDWIKHNLKDEIDFVVWTGDSARHDNDEKYPRTVKQVEGLNEYVVSKFDEVFGKPDNKNDPDPTNDFVVPIVPTYGNNDFLPHNIFEPGPNKWTRRFLLIWEKFVPQEQRHTFARGGYFFTEVIPNKLAVFSLNTMYFFESNAAVDGCEADTEPGYEHFEWLRIQLEFLRRRKMKAILMGHVPPARTESKQNWDETCYQKYALWLRQYRDVVVGNIFGHMNVDHFVLQDVRDLTFDFDIEGIDDEGLRDRGASINAGLHLAAKPDYLNDLRDRWEHLPSPPRGASYTTADLEAEKKKKKKKGKRKQLEKFMKEIGGPYGERFSMSFISPSVVPNYYPTLRVIEYNITGMENDHPAMVPTAPEENIWLDPELQNGDNEAWMTDKNFKSEYDISDDHIEIDKKKKKHKKKKGKNKKPNFAVPKPPSRTSAPGPGYSPQPLSFVSWTQYYANLTKINEMTAKELEASDLHEDGVLFDALREQTMKNHFNYEVEYNTKNDSIYPMKDLTVRSWLDYAEKAAREKYNPPSHKSKLEESSLSDVERLDSAIKISSQHDMEETEDDTLSAACSTYLRNLKTEALELARESNSYSWPSNLLIRLKNEPLFSTCLFNIEEILNLDAENSNEDIPDASPNDTESEDDIDNDTQDESDEDNADNDNDFSTSKKKHKKNKKKQKRKGASIKKNHLWHAFVRRAFVGSMSYEELKDEFG